MLRLLLDHVIYFKTSSHSLLPAESYNSRLMYVKSKYLRFNLYNYERNWNFFCIYILYTDEYLVISSSALRRQNEMLHKLYFRLSARDSQWMTPAGDLQRARAITINAQGMQWHLKGTRLKELERHRHSPCSIPRMINTRNERKGSRRSAGCIKARFVLGRWSLFLTFISFRSPDWDLIEYLRQSASLIRRHIR